MLSRQPLNRIQKRLTDISLTLCLLLCFASLSQAQLFDDNSGNAFLPVDEAYQLDLDTDDTTALWNITEQYYLYKHAFKFSFTPSGSNTAISIDATIPEGDRHHDEYFGEVETYRQQIAIPLNLPAASGELHISYQGCADAGLCYPPKTVSFTLGDASANAEPSISPEQIAASPASQSSPSKELDLGLIGAIISAFLGGLILNLMPCVFPVLAIKALSLSEHRDSRSPLSHGIAYSIGVISSFVVIAALLISLKAGGEAIGWGFQLQNTVFVAALAYLFFVMALSLSGHLELGNRLMGIGQSLTEKQGLNGSFNTGILAVMVASPCTAPFMGGALGFALSQTNTVALLVFAALGAGMALPFLLLSASPKFAALLPRPGPWMETFKQFLAFPLYASCIWLIWVAGNQLGTNAMASILIGCLSIAMAVWLINMRTSGIKKLFRQITIAISLSVALLTLYNFAVPTSNNDQSINYSAAKLKQAIESGQPVFLNVTADWCITCLANEKAVLSQSEVIDSMTANDIIYIKADWTRHDPEITQLIESYGRSGIPLYVYFKPEQAHGQVLPQLLNKTLILSLFNNK